MVVQGWMGFNIKGQDWEWMVGWFDGLIDGLMVGWFDGLIDGLIDGWFDGWLV